MADTPIREQSALELLETHAKALEAENARLTRELEIQKQGQNAITNGLCAERDRLSAALRGMLKMFGHPREEEYIDNGPSYRMAMDAVDLAMAVLAGSPVETNCMRVAGPEASGEATGPEGDDSNMGTAPTSGPEATSSQGNAERTAAIHDWLEFDRAPAAQCRRCKAVTWHNPPPPGPCSAVETTPQAPIANLVIDENGECSAACMYAPGLPPGAHDVYLDPAAPGLPEIALSMLSALDYGTDIEPSSYFHTQLKTLLAVNG